VNIILGKWIDRIEKVDLIRIWKEWRIFGALNRMIE
jgi:hypothetical protein